MRIHPSFHTFNAQPVVQPIVVQQASTASSLVGCQYLEPKDSPMNLNNPASRVYALQQEARCPNGEADWVAYALLPKAPCLHSYDPMFSEPTYDINAKLDLNDTQKACLHALLPASAQSALAGASVEYFFVSQCFNKNDIQYTAGAETPLQIKPQHWLTANNPTGEGASAEAFQCQVELYFDITAPHAAREEAAVLSRNKIHRADPNRIVFPSQAFTVHGNRCSPNVASIYLDKNRPEHLFISVITYGNRVAFTCHRVAFKDPSDPYPYCLKPFQRSEMVRHLEANNQNAIQGLLKHTIGIKP